MSYEDKIDKQIQDAEDGKGSKLTDKQRVEALGQRLKYRNSLSTEVQGAMDKMAQKLNELIEHDLETYGLLFNPDALYGDSPLGKPFIWSYAKQYLIKKDLDFVGYHLDGKFSIVPFKDRMTEATKWAERFTKPIAPKKTGIDAIIGEEQHV